MYIFFASVAYILGFEHDAWISVNNWRTAPHYAYIKAGLYSLFVYSDIVQYEMVGDRYSTFSARGQPFCKEHDVISMALTKKNTTAKGTNQNVWG